jgi:hypothetical protein
MKSIASIAREASQAICIEKICSEQIAEYRSKAASLELLRKEVKLKLKCDIGKGLAGVGSVLGTKEILQVQRASVATTLLAGCLYALDKIE